MEGSKNAFTHVRASLKKLMGLTIRDSDHIDLVTKLSILQESHIKSNWTSVTSRSDFGKKLMLRFLEIHPQHQRFFESMLSSDKNWTLALTRHADKVVSALTCIVESIDDPTILMATLRRTANTHHRLGVGIQEFQDICDVLVQVLKEELGEDFSSEVEEAWLIAMKTVCDAIAGEIQNKRA